MGNPDAFDPYEVLGVARDADDRTVAAAFHAEARSYHPDLHPDATDAERARLSEAMARVNAAYTTIRAERRRFGTPPHDTAPPRQERPSSAAGESPRTGASQPPPRREPPPSRLHPPTLAQCMFCGAEPVSAVRFEYVQAYVIRATYSRLEGPMCRSCGQAMGRAAQNRTLVTGWWGVFSFFRNLLAVLSNSVALARLGALGTPRRLDDDVVAPIAEPMAPGRPVLARSGPYVAIVAFLVIGAVLGNNSHAQSSDSGSSPSGDPIPTADWAVGSCVAESTTDSALVTPVSCGAAHDGAIVAELGAGGDCRPAVSSGEGGYVDREGARFCIDSSR